MKMVFLLFLTCSDDDGHVKRILEKFKIAFLSSSLFKSL